MLYHILVGSSANDITTITFDDAVGSLEVKSSLTVGHNPSWITSHPSHPSLVWTLLGQPDGKILALKHDENGKLEIVSETSSGGERPCSVLALKDELLVANYGSGHVGILPLSPNSPQLPSSPVAVKLSGSGPNKSRQQSSHPHQVVVYEPYQELLVPDLGSDRVCRFKKDDKGSWEICGHIGFEAGGGPRHIAFYNGDLFTLLELTSKVVRHRFPPLPATPSFVKSAPTMSNPPEPSDMLAAEILIPPPNASFPIPYLYASNRDDPSPEGDLISVFAIEEPDSLELITEFRTGLKHLRGMAFGGPDDKYLVAGGMNGVGVKVFERINDGKSFKLVASNDTVQGPKGFLWL